MYLAHENTKEHLDQFLEKIKEKPDTWRVISIEFQPNEILETKLFENLCAKSLTSIFEQTECKIFWSKPHFILIFFQGRALPIEKCVEEFFKATEFKGFGQFFDILDLSIHWKSLLSLTERIEKETSKPEKQSSKAEDIKSSSLAEGFKIELSAEKIKQLSPLRNGRTKKLLLLVEDDPFTLQLVKLALKDGYDIITAETARQALAYYQRHLPDMVFLDIQLPDGNGVQLLEQITTADRHAYIVMLSSHTQKEKIIECQSKGAKGFIGKPFTRQRLVDTVSKFISSTGKIEPVEDRHGT